MKRRRRGYVLVMTLGLLVLASTLLVTIGREAARRSLEARVAQSQLQRRWGTISCKAAVLPWCSDILAREEAEANRPMPAVRTSVTLGGERFSLIVSDEQSKANLNVLLEQSDRSSVETRIREAISGSGLGNAVLLRPEPTPPTSATTRPVQAWISGLGQIFDRVTPATLLENRTTSPSQIVTCWGDGSINILRAPENALRLAAGRALTEIEIARLIEARNQSFEPRKREGTAASAGNDVVTTLLAAAKVDSKARATVGFATTSSCYSLWTIAQDRERSWYQLSVIDQANPRQPVVSSFEW
jgi:hypothetical protein